MNASVWRIGQLLNVVQSTFVGLLRVWSIPIVLLLSLASGYTTYYGMSFFITDWIALIITVAVQSIVVICTLELAGIHWRANPLRFLSIGVSLVVALAVSISFSYFKFYEVSQRDILQSTKQRAFENTVQTYIDQVAKTSAELIGDQRNRTDAAGNEANQAFLGATPTLNGEHRHKIGRGRVWSHFNALHDIEKKKLEKLETALAEVDGRLTELRVALHEYILKLDDETQYRRLVTVLAAAQNTAARFAAGFGKSPPPTPTLPSFAELNRGFTPSFDMWRHISGFALACAAMVDFFTLILSYRLESTAPGPLTETEKELAYRGLRQFSEFSINRNDELEFRIDKTELERARRVPDWGRMFTVAFLLNRGYLRKISHSRVEFAPNLYPIIADRITRLRDEAANDGKVEPHAEHRHG